MWLQCRARRVEGLALQGRWGLLAQECRRSLQEMAEVNEQLLSRQVMWRKVQMDVQQGQTDLVVDTLHEALMGARRLAQDDHRTARVHAYLGDLQRSHGDWEAALRSYEEAERILERGLAAVGLVQSKSTYVPTVCVTIKVGAATLSVSVSVLRARALRWRGPDALCVGQVKLRIAQLSMAEEGPEVWTVTRASLRGSWR